VWSRNLVNEEAMTHWGGGMFYKKKNRMQKQNSIYFGG
jgi:hypothetical protein